MRILITYTLLLISTLISGNLTLHADNSAPNDAKDITPINIGEKLPNASIRDIKSKPIQIQSLINGQKSILIFYRGGWCPYCNTQLGEIAKIEQQLIDLGYQVIAISPDKPENLAKAKFKGKLNYQLFSDSKMDLAKALGIAFKVDDATIDKYINQYKIDVERDSGENHHLLPVPTVIIVDKQGIVKYRYYNADYKIRLKSDELIKAAKE